MPKVSVLMPACNVETFLEECMDSVVNQTLKDIEIICVNDGSKDSTGQILDQYAKKDTRIKVIHKVNTGYGNSMNIALDHASGEYIGIIETDDYADLDMFENLYNTAKRYNVDVVKTNYYTYVSTPKPKSTFFEVLKPFEKYNEVFCPSDFQDIFRVRPCIWTGIYKREMLVKNNVRFNETPGASYQDTGFAFKVWASAASVILLRDAYLHYRVDNANSSVKSAAKIFCLCDEYESIDQFLDFHPEKKDRLMGIKTYLKYESYRWNYERLALEFKYAFLLKMKEELLCARQNGELKKELFKDFQWNKLLKILDNTDVFFKESCKKELLGRENVQDLTIDYKKLKKEVRVLKKRNEEIENSTSFKVGKKITYIPRSLKKWRRGNA